MRTDIIAEIASAHEGRMETLLAMVDAAKAADCDFVKFQMFRAKELVAEDHPKYENYHVKEYSEEEWVSVSKYCEEKGIPIILELFDVPSFFIAQKMVGVAGFKIHSTAIFDMELLSHIAKENKRIFLSTGGTTKEEVKEALEIIKQFHSAEIVLLHGFQNFPTKLKDIHLDKIDSFRREFDLPIAIQDHVAGEDIMAMIVPMMAVAKGCVAIEKHFTLDRDLKESDYFSSLNPDELTRFVQLVRQAEIALGSDSFEMSEEEMTYRNLLKKSIFSKVDIPGNTEITRAHLCFRRSLEEDRILVDQTSKVIGSKSAIYIKANTRLSWEQLTK